MKLFTAARGNTEQEKALSREKSFNDEFGALQSEWYQRTISSGMPANQVLNEIPNHEASRYSPEQEHQFAIYARWLHKAAPAQFEIGKDTASRNKKVWSLFSMGHTEREIADALDLHRKTVYNILVKLQSRCHEDTRNGLLDADSDSRSEINQWTRLQAIKQKHLTMLRNGTLAETIADSIIDSGCLIKLPYDQEVIDALNESTAQIALALAVGE
jgi:hypothetical protein